MLKLTKIQVKLSVPEDLSSFKKHSFPKQGSSPGKEHHDPRPTFWEGTEICTLQNSQRAPKCGKTSATVHQFQDQGLQEL